MGAPELLSVYRGLRVLVTGDTGFKGSWLCALLLDLGADVTGLALPAETPSHFHTLELSKRMRHVDCDIRNLELTSLTIQEARPDVVLHLAAQPLVRDSYADPVTTFATNVLGTTHVLEAIRKTPSIRAAVIVTSDKCYENREWEWAYRENDRMGGHDPYSASKGAAELVLSSYRRSFFGPKRPSLGVASARAGNVIGGGDWARDRLVPDCARTLLDGGLLTLRNPGAVRPWQHVLEPVGGYLLLGARLLAQPQRFSTAYNFGPDDSAAVTVGALAQSFQRAFGTGEIIVEQAQDGLHEAKLLRLACEKARGELGFRPLLSAEECIEWTARWYRTFREDAASARALTLQQLREYQARLQIGAVNS